MLDQVAQALQDMFAVSPEPSTHLNPANPGAHRRSIARLDVIYAESSASE